MCKLCHLCKKKMYISYWNWTNMYDEATALHNLDHVFFSVLRILMTLFSICFGTIMSSWKKSHGQSTSYHTKIYFLISSWVNVWSTRQKCWQCMLIKKQWNANSQRNKRSKYCPKNITHPSNLQIHFSFQQREDSLTSDNLVVCGHDENDYDENYCDLEWRSIKQWLTGFSALYVDCDFTRLAFMIRFIAFRNISLREKCPNTEFFLVRIFLYSDWIRKFMSKSWYSVRIQENVDQNTLRVCPSFSQFYNLFTQSFLLSFTGGMWLLNILKLN